MQRNLLHALIAQNFICGDLDQTHEEVATAGYTKRLIWMVIIFSQDFIEYHAYSLN